MTSRYFDFPYDKRYRYDAAARTQGRESWLLDVQIWGWVLDEVYGTMEDVGGCGLGIVSVV